MFLPLLQARRSVRRFESRPVEAGKVAMLLEAALRAPSSRGLRPWEFIRITDSGTLAALGRVKAHGAEFLAGAPLAVAICADPARCDVWIEDCAVAAVLMQLAAVDLGLGSCWAQLRQRCNAEGRCSESVARELLDLPDGFTVPIILGFGYPAEHPRGHDRATLPWAKVHEERYRRGLDRDGGSY